MIAVKRLQSLFWVLLVALGALAAYLVSLRVATERNDLMHVRAQIAQARADIRYLETEFSARANMRQLEAWNAEDFRYSALTAEHYLDSERQLATLDGVTPNGPTFVARPVMVAMATAADPAQAVDVPSPAAMQIRSDAVTIRAESAEDKKPVRAALLASAESSGRVLLSSRPDASGRVKGEPSAALGAVARRAERMAMLDSRLLDDGTLGDIGRRAAVEIGGSLR
ncbi:MAG: colicin transporter [Sphingobium sp.]